MFLKKTILKKLLKQAYKSKNGLVIQRSGEWIELIGEHWRVSIVKSHIPKEILGEMIALVGELPERGQRFNASKEGNQIEINTGWIFPEEEFVDQDGVYVITNTYQEDTTGTLQRILQDEDTGKLGFISNTFALLLDESEAFEAGESFPEKATYKNKMVYWRNEYCRLQVFERVSEYNKVAKEALAGIDLRFEI